MIINAENLESKKVTYFVGASGITNLPAKYKKVEKIPTKKPSFLPKKPLTDESIMPWGIHAGKKLADVPAKYLLNLHEQNKLDNPLKKYVTENFSILLEEVENNYFKSTFNNWLNREKDPEKQDKAQKIHKENLVNFRA